MLAYIKGTLEMKMTGYIVIDVGGLGYKVFMSDSGIEKLGNIGDTVKVHTYYKVREDDISIFGFNTLEELKMFELLLHQVMCFFHFDQPLDEVVQMYFHLL